MHTYSFKNLENELNNLSNDLKISQNFLNVIKKANETLKDTQDVIHDIGKSIKNIPTLQNNFFTPELIDAINKVIITHNVLEPYFDVFPSDDFETLADYQNRLYNFLISYRNEVKNKHLTIKQVLALLLFLIRIMITFNPNNPIVELSINFYQNTYIDYNIENYIANTTETNL